MFQLLILPLSPRAFYFQRPCNIPLAGCWLLSPISCSGSYAGFCSMPGAEQGWERAKSPPWGGFLLRPSDSAGPTFGHEHSCRGKVLTLAPPCVCRSCVCALLMLCLYAYRPKEKEIGVRNRSFWASHALGLVCRGKSPPEMSGGD